MIFCQSPNKQTGRAGYKPEAVVIHVCEGTFDGTKAWFLNPASKVSAHFLISDESLIYQFVKCEDTAWHAGVIVRPIWKKLKEGVNPNRYTIGIELAGFCKDKPTLSKMVTAARLVRALCNRFNIEVNNQNIIPHYWIHGGKTCPGPNINLDALIYMASLPLDTSDMNII